jgi:NitT/TauT family transport system substrate-binding protein
MKGFVVLRYRKFRKALNVHGTHTVCYILYTKQRNLLYEVTVMFRRIAMVFLAGLVFASCAGFGGSDTTMVRKIVVGMPYIPNVQFAAFYVAKEQGFFAAEGLDVSFDYNFENDVVQRVATGAGVDFALASADTILLARAQSVPVVAVLATSQVFPVGFISKQGLPLATPADLKGKVVGIPGRFGASYFGLNALLASAGMTEADVTIQEIGFNQTPALIEDKVQVISGYVNNEPIVLEKNGVAVNVLRVSDFFAVGSDHLIVSEAFLAADREVVKAFTRALKKGMQSAIANPESAHADALKQIPEAQHGDTTVSMAVLKATTPMWQGIDGALGGITPSAWENSAEVLTAMGTLQQPADLPKAYDLAINE